MVDRCVGPLASRMTAFQGPSGNPLLSTTVPNSDSPGLSGETSSTGKDPLRIPPGPFERVRLPMMSSGPWPLLWTVAATDGAPVAERRAVSPATVKLGGGVPPGPIEMYMRTPTRFTRVTPASADDGAETSAQMTA